MTTKRSVLLLVLLMSMLYSAPAHAETVLPAPVPAIYLDDQQLQLEAQPLIVSGSILVPMRELFEAQGAKSILEWSYQNDNSDQKRYDANLPCWRKTAYVNGQSISLSVPGRITQGYTMMPLRVFSEALGSTVKWDAKTKTARMFSAIDYATTVLSGVNLRSTQIQRLIPLVYKCYPLERRFMSSRRLVLSGWK